jgi:hypothetical protein
MFVDEFIGIRQGHPDDWFPMTAVMGSEHAATIVR